MTTSPEDEPIGHSLLLFRSNVFIFNTTPPWTGHTALRNQGRYLPERDLRYVIGGYKYLCEKKCSAKNYCSYSREVQPTQNPFLNPNTWQARLTHKFEVSVQREPHIHLQKVDNEKHIQTLV